ncbi:MAG: endonuclease [Methylibium sp.]|uniref:LAGLIDADG family homing endonuclease n=1 Tax=Methylibium sp. TaxID=2067992 RepID=UPI0017B3C747|nr:LAGLIDADG family homing endonuclease [Methylibium sp.]MBA2722515.1 endonuclease [Methylibium sp.]MBA3589064.1 endonuclease [Methylibium sp.]
MASAASTRSPALPDFSPAWAAGFADGEGCIHIAHQIYSTTRPRNPTYRLRFSISQNNREVLQHFLDGFGIRGHINETQRTPGENRQAYVLQYDGRQAFEVIALLKDLLVRKRHEAVVALRFWLEGLCGTRFGRNGMPPEVLRFRRACYAKLRRLK